MGGHPACLEQADTVQECRTACARNQTTKNATSSIYEWSRKNDRKQGESQEDYMATLPATWNPAVPAGIADPGDLGEGERSVHVDLRLVAEGEHD